MDAMITPENSIGKLLQLTDIGWLFGVSPLETDTEKEYWLLVGILAKKSHFPYNQLEDPEYSYEAIYDLSFLLNDKLYKLYTIPGKDFSRYFKLADNETK